MRRLYPIAAGAAFVALSALVLIVGSGAFAAAQERTVRYRTIAEAMTPALAPTASVDWREAVRPLARPFTDADRHIVGRALAEAWRAHATASASGETYLLADYFSGVALERAALSAREAHAGHTRLAVLEQTAAPAFYHLDGSVLQVETEALSVRFAMDEDRLSQIALTRDRLVTTLMNETTGWRVFLHEMTGSTPLTRPAAPHVPAGRLSGLNYYPAKTPWRRFWPEFDAGIVARDLDRIRGLGANAVRIFLSTEDFAEGSVAIGHLQTFLGLARDRGLRVVPTLFDMRQGYEAALWSADAAWLRRFLPVLARSDAIAYVDLKNEPDLDFAAHGPALVEAWLRTMAALSREIAPALPLTVGWAEAAPAARFASLVDVVSYHDYAPLDGTAERLAAVRAAAGARPVHVTEIGASSYQVLGGFPGSPDAQARALETRLAGLAQADGVFVWTLHDFEAPDALAVGSSAWTRALQGRFGLFAPDGSPKPAAGVTEAAFRARGDHPSE